LLNLWLSIKISISNLKSISIWKKIWHRKLMNFTNKHDFLLLFYSFFYELNTTTFQTQHSKAPCLPKAFVFQTSTNKTSLPSNWKIIKLIKFNNNTKNFHIGG
jgi:hypothetical protein